MRKRGLEDNVGPLLLSRALNTGVTIDRLNFTRQQPAHG